MKELLEAAIASDIEVDRAKQRHENDLWRFVRAYLGVPADLRNEGIVVERCRDYFGKPVDTNYRFLVKGVRLWRHVGHSTVYLEGTAIKKSGEVGTAPRGCEISELKLSDRSAR